MVAVVALLAVLCATAAAPVAAEVKTLSETNFDADLANAEVALVKFYAPWCGHCKALAPVFVEASEKLKDEAVLAEVDCTVDKSLAKRFNIQGFPTLILFKKGKEAGRYEGSREVNDLVSYVRSQVGDALHPIATSDELLSMKQNASTPLCVIKTESANSTLAQMMAPVAESLRSVFTFALVTDAAVLPETAMESVTVMRSGDEVEAYHGNTSDESELQNFLKVATTPYFGEINAQTYRSYVAVAHQPMGWLFLGKNDHHLKELVLPVAQKYREKLVMCWLNAELYGAVGQQMALPTNVTYPAFVIESNKQHHVQPLDAPINETTIAEYIERFLHGEAKPTLLSQPVPEPETTNGLTTFVGSSLPEHLKTGKDILVFFYAPWCQHCKNLHPIYEKLAQRFEGSANLLIGKFDITTNNYEPDRFTVDGIPTVYFVPANGSPVLFTGDRTESALVEFVKSHATMPLTLKESEATSENKSTSQHDNDTEQSGSSDNGASEDDEGKDDL